MLLEEGSIEDLGGIETPGVYLSPAPSIPGPESGNGSDASVVQLTVVGSPSGISIDEFSSRFEPSKNGRAVPFLPTARYAQVGDLLEFSVLNRTGLAHPFHHHGFSFQFHGVVLRMRLDDRPRITDGANDIERFASGGAAGRWLFHCHVLLHARLGMILELVVLDVDRDEDGFDTSTDCDEADPSIPGPEICGNGIDNECSGEVDNGCASL